MDATDKEVKAAGDKVRAKYAGAIESLAKDDGDDWWRQQDSDIEWLRSHDAHEDYVNTDEDLEFFEYQIQRMIAKQIQHEDALTLAELRDRIEPLVQDVEFNLDEPLPEEE